MTDVNGAQQCCEGVRQRAAEKIEAVRNATVGDLIDGAMEWIKQHPGRGLAVAVTAGFVIGRWFKKS